MCISPSLVVVIIGVIVHTVSFKLTSLKAEELMQKNKNKQLYLFLKKTGNVGGDIEGRKGRSKKYCNNSYEGLVSVCMVFNR